VHQRGRVEGGGRDEGGRAQRRVGHDVDPPEPRPDRRDQRRDVPGAVQVFQERGLNAPLEDVAQRAGVSIGTLYNRFASRQELVDAVVPELAATKLGQAIQRVRAQTSPWRRFAGYVEEM